MKTQEQVLQWCLDNRRITQAQYVTATAKMQKLADIKNKSDLVLNAMSQSELIQAIKDLRGD